MGGNVCAVYHFLKRERYDKSFDLEEGISDQASTLGVVR